MARRKISAGITGVTVPIQVDDTSSTTGGGLTLAYNASGLVGEYRRQGQSTWTAITLAAGTLGTWSSGGWVADGALAGSYEVGIPDAALASGARWATVRFRGATNMAPVLLEFELDAVNYQDATAFGLSRLDAAVSSRMATYTQPTGFLAAAFPTTVASTTNITTAAGVTLASTQAFNNTGQTTAQPSDVTKWNGTAVPAPTVAGYPLVDVSKVNGTAAAPITTGFDANIVSVNGTTFAGSNVPTAVPTDGSLSVTLKSGTHTGAVIPSVTLVATTTALTNPVASVTGSVGSVAGSVVGSVASVTGNVNGNVVGSVASVTGAVNSVTNPVTLTSAYDPAKTAAPTPAANAVALVDLATTGHTTAGTFGSAIVAAGSAGDPWGTSLPGSYGAGSAGYLVGTNLNATVSSRLAAAGYTAPPDVSGLATATNLALVKTDTAAILGQTGTTGVVVASGSKAGYSLAAAGVDAIPVEAGVNLRQAAALNLAMLAGTISGATSIGGTCTISGGGVAATRVVMTGSPAGNRSGITLTPPA